MEVNCFSPETLLQRELNGTPAAVENGIINPVASANTPLAKEEIAPEHLRKIFVGGLSTQTTAGTIRKFFEQFGVVADATVMRDPVTNHSRGFGFVTFVDPQSVENVQRARPHSIDNKNVETKRALPRQDFVKSSRAISAAKCGLGLPVAKTSKIFLGGLKDCHDENSIIEYFSQFGKIAHVKLLLDRETGRMRGFGFLEFENPACAERALAQAKHSINLHTVEVKKSTQKPENVNRVRYAVGGAARAGYIPPQPATLDCYGYNNNYNPYLAQTVLPPSAYINGWAAYVTPEMSPIDPYGAPLQRHPPPMRSSSMPAPSQGLASYGPESWSAYPKSAKYPGWSTGSVNEWQPKAGYKHVQTSTSDYANKGASPGVKIERGAGGDGLAGGKVTAPEVSIGTGAAEKKWPTENYKIFKPAQGTGQLMNPKTETGGSSPAYGI